MADSRDTRIASAIQQPTTRRALVAGLAVAPIAGLPAVAGAVSAAPISEALAQAIEHHKAARAAAVAHEGPEDLPAHLEEAEAAALSELAETPCASDADLVQKLRYLLDYEKSLWGDLSDLNLFREYGSLAITLDLHFNPEALA